MSEKCVGIRRGNSEETSVCTFAGVSVRVPAGFARRIPEENSEHITAGISNGISRAIVKSLVDCTYF